MKQETNNRGSEALPAWCEALQLSLLEMADQLRRELRPWKGPEHVFTPEEFGFVPGQLGTEAIQRAIDRAGEKGGIVRLARGDYAAGTLILRSHVCLEICAGARLLGSTELADYPEHHARRLTVQDTSMGMHQSLIFAEGCEDICLRGEGEIDGRGGQAHFPGEETTQGTPGRPFLLRVIDCKRVHIAGLTLKNAACWMQDYLNCEQLLMEGVTVRNHANYNNDGLDIDGCRDALIRDCRIYSGDDALCFKGASQRELKRVLVENCEFRSACNAVKVGTDTQGDFRQVLIRNCRVGGLAADPSGLKHPWADSGVSLEMADGGTLEDFWLTGLMITRARSPFFLRLDDRGRVKPGDPKPGIGTLRRVLFSHIGGGGNGPRGSYLMGIAEKPIRDIVFRDVRLRQFPSARPVTADSDFGDMRGVYPDAHMIDSVGDAPAYALWARHVDGLCLCDYSVEPEGADPRPAFLLP